jgi:urocanate hydratase
MTDLSPALHLAAPRPVSVPTGSTLHCRNWLIEAAYRMIQNNLDPAVAENPDALVVYGGIGKAARNWECFEAILRALRQLGEDTSTRRGCCWRTPTWCRAGPPGSTSTSSIARA